MSNKIDREVGYDQGGEGNEDCAPVDLDTSAPYEERSVPKYTRV